MDWLIQIFGDAQQRLFEGVVQPFLFHFGMANLLEDGYAATGWLLVGLLQIAIMIAVIVPLQRWRPVEPVVDHQAIRVDIIYTLIHRLGLFRLALFFSIDPMWDAVMGTVHVWGFPAFHLDDLWPGVTDNAWVSLLLYLVVFDLVEYWIHRGQHGLRWWWKLHALH
ncbi:MAG: fatty acid hydroxylase, partial [Comamonas sp.]